MQSQQYNLETTVKVLPFSRQIEGEEIVIGLPQFSTFLALPVDAVEILDFLASGKTIREVQSLYQEKYGQIPDLDDFLSIMQSKGFIVPSDLSTDTHQAVDRPVRYTSKPVHFAYMPISVAQSLFSPIAITLYSCLILTAIVMVSVEPSIVPSWQALAFTGNVSLKILSTAMLNFVAVFFHEMFHLTAAKSLGVPSHISISHRLWVLVAETDMTGIWSLRKNKRYLPLLAGILFDLLLSSSLLITLFLHQRLYLTIEPTVLTILRALVVSSYLRIVWQFYFFVRTDMYYVVLNLFNCKNLMSDTETYLKNKIAAVFKYIQPVDQSNIPASEMRFIKIYSFIWVFGRIAAITTLVYVTLPLLFHYIYSVFDAIFLSNSRSLSIIDMLVIVMIFIMPQLLGLFLWMRSILSSRR